MNNPQNPVTVKEAAQIIGLTTQAIYHRMKNPAFDPFVIREGKAVKITPDGLKILSGEASMPEPESAVREEPSAESGELISMREELMLTKDALIEALTEISNLKTTLVQTAEIKAEAEQKLLHAESWIENEKRAAESKIQLLEEQKANADRALQLAEARFEAKLAQQQAETAGRIASLEAQLEEAQKRKKGFFQRIFGL